MSSLEEGKWRELGKFGDADLAKSFKRTATVGFYSALTVRLPSGAIASVRQCNSNSSSALTAAHLDTVYGLPAILEVN